MEQDYSNIIDRLAVANCPIIYFHKDESHMPANFADMVKISSLYKIEQNTDINKRPIIKGLIKSTTTIDDLANNTLLSINKRKINTLPLGNEIICRTKGIYKLLNDVVKFIDLVYIVYFAYNGTRKPHVYDQEFIIVRMQTEADINDFAAWNVIKCFGSIHGGGLWHDYINIKTEVIDGTKRIVFYSANESHAMYNKPGRYKRIFRFGDDLTGTDKKWIPNKLICMIDSLESQTTNIYNYTTKQYEYNPTTDKYYNYNGLIGNAGQVSNQAWAGSNVYIYIKYYYDTINTLPYSKYEGGISNLFDSTYKQISKTTRYALFGCLLAVFIIVVMVFLVWFYKVYKPFYKFTKLKLLKFSGLVILIIAGFISFFIVCFYLGLDIFLINSNYYNDKNTVHPLLIDDES